MSKILIYFSIMLSLMTSNAFANNSETIKISQSHILTLNDVEFDKSTGEIEGYTADYKDIVIPDNFDGVSVTSIGDYAFSENTLMSVSIPNSVTEIGNSAFSSNALTSVSIPNSVTEIGKSAFSENALTSVSIPNSVIEIGESAFNKNKIVMVNDLLSNGFIYARNDDGTDNIETIVSYGGEAKDVSIPNSVTKIGESAFAYNALTNVSIPNSVIKIGKSAFSSNALTSVSIPNSVTEIGESAFDEDVIITRI
ncbi:leucine-rich repeat domain-containing protein [Photobacterium toruni]|uniref:Leucine-rich repeat domain-containing protein n=1 Tax=Photobacterium toruni TaxID=1935446 RepID=A0ABU6L1V3_9GAMM|nr:leucine-rich repeat domain-containing protein [Photobacterium toruni]